MGDYTLADGQIVWQSGSEPAEGERLSVHYLHRPVWVVWEHMKLGRRSPVKFKQDAATLETPIGNMLQLPGQVLVRLEHLPLDPG